MSDFAEELRIIAHDRPRLKERECALLNLAADTVDELERSQQALIKAQQREIEMNNRLLAIQAQLMRASLAPMSGRVTVIGYNPSWIMWGQAK
jgi:hypothetical protein